VIGEREERRAALAAELALDPPATRARNNPALGRTGEQPKIRRLEADHRGVCAARRFAAVGAEAVHRLRIRGVTLEANRAAAARASLHFRHHVLSSSR
jgi:hypothetical protein